MMPRSDTITGRGRENDALEDFGCGILGKPLGWN
jgi:hypothetical protein